jgi:hypothetical protein
MGCFERIFINISSGETEELNCNTLYCGTGNALYCKIKKGRFKAKFKRSPSFNILDRLEEGVDGRYFLRICGQRIELKVEV